jgi:hypothetical protein
MLWRLNGIVVWHKGLLLAGFIAERLSRNFEPEYLWKEITLF